MVRFAAITLLALVFAGDALADGVAVAPPNPAPLNPAPSLRCGAFAAPISRVAFVGVAGPDQTVPPRLCADVLSTPLAPRAKTRLRT